MKKHIISAALMVLVMTVITGLVYPVVITAISKLVFSAKSEGSVILVDGGIIGSELIGQNFKDPRYFWGRPSMTSGKPYNASASGGSNLGPSNQKLVENAADRIKALKAANPGNIHEIPIDLLTSSASGLDPHITPDAALYQVRRVAGARGLNENMVEALVIKSIEPRTFGILGEPRVNVLKLNIALYRLPDNR